MSETAIANSTIYPAALQSALDWLAGELSGDPLDDALALRQHLRVVLEFGVVPLQRLKLLEPFQQRAAAVTRKGRAVLRVATLPMPRQLRALARALIEAEGAIAEGFLDVVNQATKIELAAVHSSRLQLSRAALIHLAEQQEVSLLTASPATPGLWTRLQSIYAIAHDAADAAPNEVAATDRIIKGMLALAAAQPEGLTPPQIDFLIRFLQLHAGLVVVGRKQPENHTGWYWLAQQRDLAPVAAARRRPPQDGRCLFFSCAALGQVAAEIVSRWAAGGHIDGNEVPDCEPSSNCLAVLRQATTCWSAPPKRLRSRRRNNYRVEVCCDIVGLWRMLNGDLDASGEGLDSCSSDWTVVNESASGYAVIHAAGSVSGLQSGSAVGLRLSPEQPWNICLVRWARSDNPEHIELGLELIAPQARAVRIAAGAAGLNVLPALLLPPLAQLQRGESLLAARGTYSSAPFAMIQDIDGRTRVSHCVAQGLWLQTSSIEVYEFERDPLPI